jgi:glucose/arabinose dehydrogenase
MARLPSLLCCVVLLTGCPEWSRPAPASDPPGTDELAPMSTAAATAASPRQTGGPNPPDTLHVTGGPNPPANLRVTGGPNPPDSLRRTGGPNPPVRMLDPPWEKTEYARFYQPWAMTFLPDGRLLVTEKPGQLWLFNPDTRVRGEITGVPPVAYGGQGGLGDVIVHPQFASNAIVYISYAEPGAGDTRGAAVMRARLTLAGNGGSLSEQQVIWRQVPKMTGVGHFSHRLAFDRYGKLWISSGERQRFTPAQDLSTNLGKMIRLNEDGSVPPDNPWAYLGGIAAQVWSLGHRNVLGIAFDAQGRLWAHEMGPQGGDELNLIVRASNYGWPLVSNGDNYDGSDRPDHSTRPDLNAPEITWTPVIAPAGFIIYDGAQFPYYRGNGFIGGLASMSLVRVEFNGTQAREAQRWDMGRRIREVEQGPDGALWLLEDSVDGRLLKLSARPM